VALAAFSACSALHAEEAVQDAPKAPGMSASAQAVSVTAQPSTHADFGGEKPGADARAIADWVVDSGDSVRMPFVIVDKKAAHVYVFDAQGHLRGAAAALLGIALGDHSVPGVGDRELSAIRVQDRTTPAGRFEASLGRNYKGKEILWVDYDAAISMHRVRATKPIERRLQRLASPTVSDNRISYGCINLPVAFYDLSVKPTFAAHGGIVYVLPETRPLQATFPGVTPAQLASG